ncbi:MAG: SDR family NAD(P)-dependent oxidoreductase [Calditrichaeota bacterium]|nr:SDR family NAD(P)-dependent oxidoreductase [Calditrichota bacterium]
MEKINIVTGGGTGIGRSICNILAQNGHKVLIVGRRLDKLKETQSYFPDRIDILKADISNEEDRKKIKDSVREKQIGFLVHNAAVLGKITGLENISLEEWRRVMSINVEAPLFLTQALLPNLGNSRILNISSGAAHFAIKSWGAYCTSKAALLMIYQMFNAEFGEKKILTASLRPGIVDTEMQGDIREASLEKNPHLQKFHDMFNDKSMETSERVAQFAYWVLTATSDQDYSAKEWDIREGDHVSKWDNVNK